MRFLIGSENFYVVVNDKNVCIGRPRSPHPCNYNIARDSKELCVYLTALTEFEDLLKYSAEYLNGNRPAAGRITANFFVIESHDNVAATLFIGLIMACTELQPFVISPTLMIHDTEEVQELLFLLQSVRALV